MPELTRLSNGNYVLSWQEPLSGGGYRFAMAIGKPGKWSDVRTIASSPNLSMFTADLPGIAELPGGALMAYWEMKDLREGDRYDTVIATAVSHDAGKTWFSSKQPYGDVLSGQHSFLSWFPAQDGVGLIWLDAQQRSLMRHTSIGQDRMGSVGLRYAHLNPAGETTHESFIDPIACECCPTSASLTSRGPVVVYRGRQEDVGTKPWEVRGDRATIRDIYIMRFQGGMWSEPHLVHQDNWLINACPDNGPAVDADGSNAAVAWWTRSENTPKALVAFSEDSGDTFGPAIRLDQGKAEGQVTVALLPGGKAAVVGWLEDSHAWARYVSSSGIMGPSVVLGISPRHSRLPRWLADGKGVTAAWTSEVEGHRQVQVSRLNF